MAQQWRTYRAYILALFAGYMLLFLALHWEVREPSRGLLVLPAAHYLPAALAWNPIQHVANGLGLQGAAVANALLLVALAFLSAGWLLAIRAASHTPRAPRTLLIIVLGASCFSIPLLLIPYMPFSDLYLYIIRGRIGALYGGNPLVDASILYPHDPFLPYLTHWRESAPLYGPVWMLFARALAHAAELVGGGELQYVVIFKLAAVGLHLLNTWLIWRLLNDWRPDQQVWGTVLYAWSPLALLEFAGSGHNDVLMITWVLAALWMAQRARWRMALLLLLLATFTKYSAGPLVPLYATWVLAQAADRRARLAHAAQIIAIALVCAAALYAPYWQWPALLQVGVASELNQWSVNTLFELATRVLPRIFERLGAGADPQLIGGLVTHSINWLIKVLWLLFVGFGMLALWRRPTFERFVQCCGWVWLGGLLFATAWFWPWYATWPLALAALLDWRSYGRIVALFSCTSMFIYTVWPGRPLVAFVPPLLLLGLTLWQLRRDGSLRFQLTDVAHPTADRITGSSNVAHKSTAAQAHQFAHAGRIVSFKRPSRK